MGTGTAIPTTMRAGTAKAVIPIAEEVRHIDNRIIENGKVQVSLPTETMHDIVGETLHTRRSEVGMAAGAITSPPAQPLSAQATITMSAVRTVMGTAPRSEVIPIAGGDAARRQAHH
jgi:hypothetical protein